MSERVIYVAGTAAGGTSCVAGVLHHLGVDMGVFPMREGNRGYITFEDTQINDYKTHPPGGSAGALHQRCRFDEYLEMRLRTSTSSRCGVKCSPLFWYGFDPTKLPIDPLIVTRPLEDAVLSNVQTWARIVRRDYPQRGEWTDQRELRIAGEVAMAWIAARKLTAHLVVREVDFYDTLEEPKAAVRAIAASLALDPTDEQLTAAQRFIDPERRHI